MADPKGFLTTRQRELPARRPVPVRLMDERLSTVTARPREGGGLVVTVRLPSQAGSLPWQWRHSQRLSTSSTIPETR